MILLALLMPLGALQVEEFESVRTPTAWVREAMEANPIASNCLLEVDLVRTAPGQESEPPISFRVAWNENCDYEIRIRYNDEWAPMVACREDICIVDEQYAFERGWLEQYDIDYHALPTPPEFDETLHIAREMIQVIFRQFLFPLHSFRESRIESVWLHSRNTMLHDDSDRDVLKIASEPADLVGNVLRPEGVIYMHHQLLVEQSSGRLVGMETYFDEELVIATHWEWKAEPENEAFGLVHASTEYLEEGYEETVTLTVLSDSRISPDEVFADAAIFGLEADVVPWNDPRKPLRFWAIAGRFLPAAPIVLVGTLLALVAFLVRRLRARKAVSAA